MGERYELLLLLPSKRSYRSLFIRPTFKRMSSHGTLTSPLKSPSRTKSMPMDPRWKKMQRQTVKKNSTKGSSSDITSSDDSDESSDSDDDDETERERQRRLRKKEQKELKKQRLREEQEREQQQQEQAEAEEDDEEDQRRLRKQQKKEEKKQRLLREQQLQEKEAQDEEEEQRRLRKQQKKEEKRQRELREQQQQAQEEREQEEEEQRKLRKQKKKEEKKRREEQEQQEKEEREQRWRQQLQQQDKQQEREEQFKSPSSLKRGSFHKSSSSHGTKKPSSGKGLRDPTTSGGGPPSSPTKSPRRRPAPERRSAPGRSKSMDGIYEVFVETVLSDTENDDNDDNGLYGDVDDDAMTMFRVYDDDDDNDRKSSSSRNRRSPPPDVPTQVGTPKSSANRKQPPQGGRGGPGPPGRRPQPPPPPGAGGSGGGGFGSASRSPRSGSMAQPLRSGSSDNIPRNSARGAGPNNNNNMGMSSSSHQQRMRQQQQRGQPQQQQQQQQRPKARSNLSSSSHHTSSDDSTTDADQIEALEAKLGRLYLKLKKCEEDGDYDRASDIKFGAIPDVENKLKKIKAGGGGSGSGGTGVGGPPTPASSSANNEEEIEKLKKKLTALDAKLKKAEREGDYDRASDLKFGAIPDIKSKIQRLGGDVGGGDGSDAAAPAALKRSVTSPNAAASPSRPPAGPSRMTVSAEGTVGGGTGRAPQRTPSKIKRGKSGDLLNMVGRGGRLGATKSGDLSAMQQTIGGSAGSDDPSAPRRGRGGLGAAKSGDLSAMRRRPPPSAAKSGDLSNMMRQRPDRAGGGAPKLPPTRNPSRTVPRSRSTDFDDDDNYNNDGSNHVKNRLPPQKRGVGRSATGDISTMRRPRPRGNERLR